MRVLSMIKADTTFESDSLPDPAEMAAMGKMAQESPKRGLIVGQGGLTQEGGTGGEQLRELHGQ